MVACLARSSSAFRLSLLGAGAVNLGIRSPAPDQKIIVSGCELHRCRFGVMTAVGRGSCVADGAVTQYRDYMCLYVSVYINGIR